MEYENKNRGNNLNDENTEYDGDGGSGNIPADSLVDMLKDELDTIGKVEQPPEKIPLQEKENGSRAPENSPDYAAEDGEDLESSSGEEPKKKDAFKLNINFDTDDMPEDSSKEAQEHSENSGETKDGDTGEVLFMNEGPVLKDEEDQIDEEKLEKRRGCLKAAIYTAVILCISVLISVVVLSSLNDIYAINKPNASIEVVVPDGASNSKIAQILKKDKVIGSETVFRLYCKLHKVSGMKQGTFTLNSNMSYEKIVAALRNSLNNTATVNVTIPEGYTVQKIAALLEEKKVCSSSDFLDAINNGEFDFEYLSAIGNSSTRFYRLEGYCFPDTYNFYTSDSADDVIQKMLDNFEEKYTDEMAAEAKKMGMSVDEVVTLASVIQKESSSSDEMAKVSSVFHNRLEKGTGSLKFLQSDATVLYVTGCIQKVLGTSSSTTVGNAYNTYKCEGLPAGAICNPGLDAIEAALEPDNTDYYYFVTDKNNKYYYAETYKQHLQNVAKAEATGSAQGTDTSSK